MCGIFFSLSHDGHTLPDARTEQLLSNRGPDSIDTHRTTIPGAVPGLLHAAFVSTVLSLRGKSVVRQPLIDEHTGSVLAWNGEAWSVGGGPVAGNDSQCVFDLLLNASKATPPKTKSASAHNVVGTLSSIKGPFAFVFYDAWNGYLYYGRDCLGRRSLLRKSATNDDLILSSVCDNSSGESWAEVEADGIYVLDLDGPLSAITHAPHRLRHQHPTQSLAFSIPFLVLNKDAPLGPSAPGAKEVSILDYSLRKSLELRVHHVRESVQTTLLTHDARVAILFSGGLDCTILARLCHDIVSPDESIDLLNVAFENPRIHRNLAEGFSPFEQCPDRITGRTSFANLVSACPGRIWRFVEINVPYSETVAHRTQVMTLMHPHNTEMDLSISYALYFASRGTGHIHTDTGIPPIAYSTPARVLLSGLGADELFGGYQRHAVAYTRQGYTGLIQELELDFNRIGKRNLGRDDRVISDSGREVRFPYLDEDFISLALDLPVWAKCDFENPQDFDSADPKLFLEPGKRLLRLLAWELNIKNVAAEKKRAIQFGARTAKMETGRTKGTQVLS